MAGLFDVASAIGISKTKEGMGNTVGYYAGVEPENGGFYIVLPVIGPSNARDGVGLAIDGAVDPFSIITFGISSTAGWIYSGARYGATVVDRRSRTLFALDDLEKNSVDYYAALKAPIPSSGRTSSARSGTRPARGRSWSSATRSRWCARSRGPYTAFRSDPVMLLASRRAFLCLAVTAIALPAQAADGPAAQLIEKVAAEVIELIKAKTGPQREAGIRDVLLEEFRPALHGQGGARHPLERHHRDQRERFLKAVVSAEARAYSERFGQYGGQTLTVTRVSQRPNGVSVVDSKLNQSNGQPITIQWEVRELGQGCASRT